MSRLPVPWLVEHLIGRRQTMAGSRSAIAAAVHWCAQAAHPDTRASLFLCDETAREDQVARALLGGDWDGTGYLDLVAMLEEHPDKFAHLVAQEHRRLQEGRAA